MEGWPNLEIWRETKPEKRRENRREAKKEGGRKEGRGKHKGIRGEEGRKEMREGVKRKEEKNGAEPDFLSQSITSLLESPLP